MVDENAVRDDYENNGYSPYGLSEKYNIPIEKVYEILEGGVK